MSAPVAPSPNEFLGDLPLDELLACHECDLLMRRPPLAEGQKACCPRCGFELFTCRAQVERRSLALVITALLLFLPANFLPIMQLNLLGQTTQDTLWSAVQSLFHSGLRAVAVLVFLCSMVVPLLKLLCQLLVLLAIRWRRGLGWGRLLYRAYHHLRDWGMLEVYLMGILVSIVKLSDMADLSLGTGLYCFIALLVAQVWLEVTMSPQQIWAALEGDRDARA